MAHFRVDQGQSHSGKAGIVHCIEASRTWMVQLKVCLSVPILAGYPQGLPSWEVQSREATLEEVGFWSEYDEEQLIITPSALSG
jgi:hypothetical protein